MLGENQSERFQQRGNDVPQVDPFYLGSKEGKRYVVRTAQTFRAWRIGVQLLIERHAGRSHDHLPIHITRLFSDWLRYLTAIIVFAASVLGFLFHSLQLVHYMRIVLFFFKISSRSAVLCLCHMSPFGI